MTRRTWMRSDRLRRAASFESEEVTLSLSPNPTSKTPPGSSPVPTTTRTLFAHVRMTFYDVCTTTYVNVCNSKRERVCPACKSAPSFRDLPATTWLIHSFNYLPTTTMAAQISKKRKVRVLYDPSGVVNGGRRADGASSENRQFGDGSGPISVISG